MKNKNTLVLDFELFIKITQKIKILFSLNFNGIFKKIKKKKYFLVKKWMNLKNSIQKKKFKHLSQNKQLSVFYWFLSKNEILF